MSWSFEIEDLANVTDNSMSIEMLLIDNEDTSNNKENSW